MKQSKHRIRPLALGIAAATAALLIAGPAQSRAPYDQAEVERQQDVYLKSVSEGYDIWHGSLPSTTTNGLACGNCHPDAAASNPQTFPKYLPMFGKVVPFREMVNWCIENPQLGEALDVNGPEMTAMEAYAFKLHRGREIEPNLVTRQTVPVVVSGGKGFPSEPTGLGIDK